jgi:hypothetical protein
MLHPAHFWQLSKSTVMGTVRACAVFFSNRLISGVAMRANTVFVHQHHARMAIQTDVNEFIAIQTKKLGDIFLFDVITGDLVSGKMNALYNLTREKLIYAEVLGRFSSLIAAQWATTLERST